MHCYSLLSHGALLFIAVTWCSAIHRCHMEQSRSHVFYLWVLCSGICTESATSLGCWTWKSGNGWHFHSAFCHLCHLTCYWVGVVMSAEFANTFCRVSFSRVMCAITTCGCPNLFNFWCRAFLVLVSQRRKYLKQSATQFLLKNCIGNSHIHNYFSPRHCTNPWVHSEGCRIQKSIKPFMHFEWLWGTLGHIGAVLKLQFS